MKSLVEFIQESKSSKYDTTVYDGSVWKDRKLIPSEDENKNYIVARLGRHFFWRTKGRSNKIDDYIEKNQYEQYIMKIQDLEIDRWEAEKYRNVLKIGTATLLKITKGTAVMIFSFNKDKLFVTCNYGGGKSKKLGSYDIEDNPTDKEYEK